MLSVARGQATFILVHLRERVLMCTICVLSSYRREERKGRGLAQPRPSNFGENPFYDVREQA